MKSFYSFLRRGVQTNWREARQSYRPVCVALVSYSGKTLSPAGSYDPVPQAGEGTRGETSVGSPRDCSGEKTLYINCTPWINKGEWRTWEDFPGPGLYRTLPGHLVIRAVTITRASEPPSPGGGALRPLA